MEKPQRESLGALATTVLPATRRTPQWTLYNPFLPLLEPLHRTAVREKSNCEAFVILEPPCLQTSGKRFQTKPLGKGFRITPKQGGGARG